MGHTAEGTTVVATSVDVDADEALPTRRGLGHRLLRLAVFLLILLVVAGAFFAWRAYQYVVAPYEDCIYPNVIVLGENLDGLTRAKASKRLQEAAGRYEAAALTLSATTLDGDERAWTVPWSEAGLVLDVESTVQAAFAVGRADPPPSALHELLQFVRMRQERHEVAPVFAVDPDKVRHLLEQLAPEVAEAPADATLRLEGDRLIATPGQPGQVLDVDATLEKIVTTVTHLGPDNRFTLTFRAEQPRLLDADAARTQAEELIDREVQVSTYDVLTDEAFAWTLGRETVATWICVEQAEDGSGPTVRVLEEAVRATLVALAAELGGGRGFLLDDATSQVLEVFEAGGGAVELPMTHPPQEYLVQPGDDLSSVAARFDMPPGLIAEANPDVDLDSLRVGQQLMIPPEDVLRPYATVPGKQIVISIAEQRMRVYEDDEMLYEWPVSTGMAGSPTYTGQFQILSREANAYASQWDLWMPHFMAVYRAGGAVYNGIHALPILSNGQRLWEGALGSPASYGCIILGVEEAETLFNWAEIGVPVTIE